MLAACVLLSAAMAAEPSRPKLQIINGGTQPVDVFWLEIETERVPNGFARFFSDYYGRLPAGPGGEVFPCPYFHNHFSGNKHLESATS